VLGVVGAMVIAAALLTGAIGAGRRTTDRALILLLGIGGCLFTGIAGAVGPAGVVAARELQGTPILVAGLAVTLSAGLLLCARVAGASGIPFTPFGVLVSIGSLAAVSQWLHLGLLLTPQQVAATLPAALLVVLIFAPRIAIRMARIQGPQLPRTAKELQLDIEPMPAQEAGHRVRYADGYLTSTAVGAAVVVGASLPFLADGTFFPMLLGALIAAAVLLRARALMGAWQRVPLLAAGTLGCALLISALLTELPVQWQGVLLAALAVVFVLLLLGMTRQPLRRLRPIWGHLANGLETITAIAIVPVLLQLFGVYVWARGLAG
jgi:type VII secretion integral membrane protein EccD